MKNIINNLKKGKNLSFEDSKKLFYELMEGKHDENSTIEILESFLEKNLNVVQIKRDKIAEDNTYTAMQDGADVIYQAALSTTHFKGYADFLIKVEGHSELGNYYYEVWDTKLSKTLRQTSKIIIKENKKFKICIFFMS